MSISCGVPIQGGLLMSKVVRLKEGETLRAMVGSGGVGLLTHWVAGRSVCCVDPLEHLTCKWCGRGDVPQWQGFFPLRWERVSGGQTVPMSGIILLGSRSVQTAGEGEFRSMEGHECEFRRGKGRRFVSVQKMLVCDPFTSPVCENLAVIFGSSRFWSHEATDPFRNLLESCSRLYNVESVA